MTVGIGNSVITPGGGDAPDLVAAASVNHSAPSGPVVMPTGSAAGRGDREFGDTPPVVMRPILLARASVNHSAPSGPAVIPKGALPAVGIGNSVKMPAVVMRPILLPLIFGKPQRAVRSGRDAFGSTAGRGDRELGHRTRSRDTSDVVAGFSVNHSAPSGPDVMPKGALLSVGTGNTVMVPAVVMRPIWLASNSVNHSAPSGPAVMPLRPPPATGNSVNCPVVVIRPILLGPSIDLGNSVNHSAPSGPKVMLVGPLLAVGIGNSVVEIAPAVVMRPILLALFDEPQRAVRSRRDPKGELLAVGIGYSVSGLRRACPATPTAAANNRTMPASSKR